MNSHKNIEICVRVCLLYCVRVGERAELEASSHLIPSPHPVISFSSLSLPLSSHLFFYPLVLSSFLFLKWRRRKKERNEKTKKASTRKKEKRAITQFDCHLNPPSISLSSFFISHLSAPNDSSNLSCILSPPLCYTWCCVFHSFSLLSVVLFTISVRLNYPYTERLQVARERGKKILSWLWWWWLWVKRMFCVTWQGKEWIIEGKGEMRNERLTSQARRKERKFWMMSRHSHYKACQFLSTNIVWNCCMTATLQSSPTAVSSLVIILLHGLTHFALSLALLLFLSIWFPPFHSSLPSSLSLTS